MKKCAIIGGSTLDSNGQDIVSKLSDFGTWCANQEITLLTGACPGYPYIIGKACVGAGGTVVGYSPAANEADHLNIYGNPLDGVSSTIYLDSPVTNKDERFLLRSFPLVADADLVISVDGNWGTLYELTTAVISGKHILVLSDTRGISGGFEMLYSYMKSTCHYDYGESVTFLESVEELKAALLPML